MAANQAEVKPDVKPEVEKLDLGELEEDDDFEEFPADSKFNISYYEKYCYM